jgi:hypothetical protein
MSSDLTLFDPLLSHPLTELPAVPPERAMRLFRFFREHPLFRWQDANNDCEDRANALCILLDQWGIPNCKAWVFSGFFLNKNLGSLVNFWNYHVAAAVRVEGDTGPAFYVLDPATLQGPERVENWAAGVTHYPFSYHALRNGKDYIFPPGDIYRGRWFERDRQNYKWTLQGLSGINGVAPSGKARLVFQKARIRKTEQEFRYLLHHPPDLQD